LTHVAFGYGGYIRLTVRPQHQLCRFFLEFPIGFNNIGTARTRNFY
jgi:hypothetical protein